MSNHCTSGPLAGVGGPSPDPLPKQGLFFELNQTVMSNLRAILSPNAGEPSLRFASGHGFFIFTDER